MFDNDCACGTGPGGAFCTHQPFADGGGFCVQTKPGKAGDSPCTTSVPDNDAIGPASVFSSTNPPPSMTFSCAQADGLYCSTSGACTALAQTGQPCMQDYDCVLTDHCDTTSGTCAAGGAIGNACSSNSTCMSGMCASGCCM